MFGNQLQAKHICLLILLLQEVVAGVLMLRVAAAVQVGYSQTQLR
jgi:hypothetical protein